MKDRRNGKFYIPLLQGAAVFIWTLAIKSLTMLIIYAAGSSKDSFLRECPDWLLHAVVILAGLLIYNSVLRLIILFDKEARAAYIEGRAEIFSLSHEIADTICSKDFLLQNIAAMILFAISAILGAYPDIGGIILGKGLIGTIRCNLISTIILVPVLFIIGIFTRYEVRRYWIVLEERKDTEKIENPISFLLQAALISFAYPLIFPLAPILGFAIFNVINILISLFGALKVMGTLIVAILLIFAIYLIPLLRAMVKRRKFIKQLRDVCNSKGFMLSDIKHPYRSFFRAEIGCNFTLTGEGKEYRCAFVSTLHKGTRLCFNSETDAYFRHRLGTKNHHYTINHHIEYGIRGEGRKCIIISPLPKKVFVESDGGVREILPGDRIWNYTVYNMSGFINAIDRDCLDKWNSVG